MALKAKENLSENGRQLSLLRNVSKNIPDIFDMYRRTVTTFKNVDNPKLTF